MSKSNLPDNWEWIPLEKFATSVGGYAFPEKWQGRESLQFPFIKVSDMNKTNGYYIESAKNTVDESILAKLRAHTYPVETIIFPKVGGAIATNKKRILAQDSIFDNNIMGIVINPESFIEVKWLFYFLLTIDLMDLAHSGPLPSIRQSTINQLEIPVPFPSNPDKSRQIQSLLLARIEQVLFELTEARRLHDKIVADTNRLMESVLAEMLPNPEKGLPEGWGALPLSQLASEESNQIIPSDHPSDTFNYWGLDAISEGQIAEPPSNYIQGSEVKSTCISFTPKDVLYSKLRPYLNKVIVPTVDGIGSTEWVVYRPNPKLIRREYLAFVMRTKWFVSLASGTSYGARMPRANKSVLREIKIPIPLITDPGQSLSIQEQIVERISQFSSDVDSMQKGNAQQQRLLVQLEQSILAQAFRGEL
jgi:type I restriction enzyme S subunit